MDCRTWFRRKVTFNNIYKRQEILKEACSPAFRSDNAHRGQKISKNLINTRIYKYWPVFMFAIT